MIKIWKVGFPMKKTIPSTNPQSNTVLKYVNESLSLGNVRGLNHTVCVLYIASNIKSKYTIDYYLLVIIYFLFKCYLNRNVNKTWKRIRGSYTYTIYISILCSFELQFNNSIYGDIYIILCVYQYSPVSLMFIKIFHNIIIVVGNLQFITEKRIAV